MTKLYDRAAEEGDAEHHRAEPGGACGTSLVIRLTDDRDTKMANSFAGYVTVAGELFVGAANLITANPAQLSVIYGNANGTSYKTGVWGGSSAGTGVLGSGGIGVQGEAAPQGVGVVGMIYMSQGVPPPSAAPPPSTGVFGFSNDAGAAGVVGNSDGGVGVAGNSNTGLGVVGTSIAADGVTGNSSSPLHAGVAANNLSNSGSCFGVWAQCPNGTAGHFQSNTGLGVVGTSIAADGVTGNSSSPLHAGVAANNLSGGGFGVWAQAKKPGKAGHFEGDVEVTGDVILLGAGDCAERFDVQEDALIEPGTVMVCDESEILRACEKGYDKKVAGVISGAGALRPGLILAGYSYGRDSSHKSVPLALVGRVYCKVDAEYAPVEVGDLLTSSPTPGHAMKASDPFLAFGAVIGKALRRQGSGRGLIPILIALQ